MRSVRRKSLSGGSHEQVLQLVEYLRDCHACVGVVESTVNPQPVNIGLICVEVYYVTPLRLDPIFVEVADTIQGRMASRAVITLLG